MSFPADAEPTPGTAADVPSPAGAGEPSKGKAAKASAKASTTTKIKAIGGTLSVTTEPVDPQGTDAARAAGAKEAAEAVKASADFGRQNRAFIAEIAKELDKSSGSIKHDEKEAQKAILTGKESLGQARAIQAEQAQGVLMSSTLDSWSLHGQQVPGNVSAIRNTAARDDAEPIGGRR